MDPHALSQGRTMLLVRGGIAFLIGVVISNQPGASADALMNLFGLWALLEGAATIRQAYARVDQSADEGPTDVDAAGRGNLGAWEASGIIDVSRWFGAGNFLVTVQAHTLWVAKDTPTDGVGHEGQPFTYKREGGQVLLLHIPGG